MRRLIICAIIAVQLLLGDAPQKQPQLTYTCAKIDQITEHPVNVQFLRDSIQRQGPRVPIRIITILQPLKPSILGITHYIDENTYVIGLNSLYPTSLLQMVMTHELTHVQQFNNNLLKTINGISYWKNQQVNWNIPHEKRAWEIHAHQTQHKLWELYRSSKPARPTN